MKYFIITILILSLIEFSYAGTVTLTGTCSKNINENFVNFSLINEGNQAATFLKIIPKMQNVTLNKTEYFLSSLTPNKTYFTDFFFKNITANGTYVDYFNVNYTQSNNSFSAVFPCLESFYTNTDSKILLTKNVTDKNGTYYINITAFNNGNTDKLVNISLILPDDFQFLTKNYTLTKIKNQRNKTIQFIVKTGSKIGSYSGAIIASYDNNNLHFATYQQIIISQNQESSTNQNNNFNIFTFLIGIIFIIFLILIIRAFLKSKELIEIIYFIKSKI
ncbi:MAG: hypothetical protein QXD23_00930 [Candidatus Micrarchaeaceae archaeon]